MQRIMLQLDTLTCPSCMQKIEGALQGIAGVQKVKVLFNASKVKADIDSSQTNAEMLEVKIEKLGYTVKHVKIKELS